MAIQNWNPDPSLNGTIGAINIAEGCPSANMNNAIRELMAQMAVWFQNTGYQPYDDTLQSLSQIVGRNNALPIFNGVAGLELADISAFMRVLLLAADGGAVCQSIGAVRVASLSLSSPGHIRFQLGSSQFFQVAWGTFTAAANAGGNANYSATFPNAAFPICGGAVQVSATTRNTPGVVAGASAANGFSYFNAADYAVPSFYIAVGY